MRQNAPKIAVRAKQVKIIWNETPSVGIANEFDMRSQCFCNKSATSWKYSAKIFARRSIFHRKNIHRRVIIEVNLKIPQISAHKADRVSFSLLFLCASQKNAQTNCQCNSSQFIASKMQETRSHGNPKLFIVGGA